MKPANDRRAMPFWHHHASPKLFHMATFFAFALAGGCTSTPVPPRDFEECVARGNAIMESFPRQCRDEGSGKLFREKGEAVVPAQ